VPRTAGPRAALNVLSASSLGDIPWLVHGFSTRVGGFSRLYGGETLNLGFTKGDSKSTVECNRTVFLAACGVRNPRRAKSPSRTLRGATSAVDNLVTLRQVHSDIIHMIASVPESPLVGDGLITNVPGLILAIQTADCLPIILVDPKRRAVGGFHAGWRGTAKRIVEKGVGAMRQWFGSRARDLKAAIGPGIHGCCYTVGEEVREMFESQFAYAAKLFREVKESDPVREKYPLLFLTARAPGHSDLPKKIFLDLVEANRQQLLSAGLSANNIEASPLCTSCRTDLLFSHRAENGRTGRMMAVVGIQ
jgi:polyphenol oxidase